MFATAVESRSAQEIELRQEAHYWRAQHARAVEREAAWKTKCRELEATVRQQEAATAQLGQQIEALKGRMAWLQQQVFGRKGERTAEASSDTPNNVSDPSDVSPNFWHESSEAQCDDRRERGQQKGVKGHGRKPRLNLPTAETLHTLPEENRRCPKCGKPFRLFPGTEDSEEIEWEVVLRRRIHKRTRYQPTCDCEAVPGIVTAPPPPKLIPKGLFSISFWVRLILEKFLFQRPLHRVRKVLALEGLPVSQGTLTGGLKRIGELLQPVYARILERNRAANHWKMDETRWLVFQAVEGKKGYRWWLWVVITEDTVVYLLEPTRSSQVPRTHLGENPEGILNADRYKVYQLLGDHLFVAFCWSHVRRDFIRVRDGYPSLRSWGEAWVTRINEMFHLNNERLPIGSSPEAFGVADHTLREAVEAMAEVRERQLADPDLPQAARKVLESLRNHWDGCTLFVDHPDIPMDNNESERQLRDPVVGRKNYYGSGSVWSGALTAILFTIFQTLLKTHVDPQKWLFAYFEACARNGGCPPEEIDAFLPWNLSEEQKPAWGYPEKPT